LIHLRAQLALPDSVAVLRTIQGDAESISDAMAKLVEQAGGGLLESAAQLDENVLKQSTIRVQINPEDM